MTYFRAPSRTSSTSVQRKQNATRPQVFAQRARSSTGRPQQGARANCDADRSPCADDQKASCVGGGDCKDAHAGGRLGGTTRRAGQNDCAAAPARQPRRRWLHQRLGWTVRKTRRADHLREGTPEVDFSAKLVVLRGKGAGDRTIRAGAVHQERTNPPSQLSGPPAPQAARPRWRHRESRWPQWPATVALEASRNSGGPLAPRGASQG
jgi:hypothetical protein